MLINIKTPFPHVFLLNIFFLFISSLGLSSLSLQFYKNLATGLKDIVWKAEPIDEEKDG